MIRRSIARGAALAVLASIAATACSKHERPEILGHWRAERWQLYSVGLPVGPDIVIREHAISSPGASASIPLKGISRSDDSALLDLPYGVGVSFYFDGPDRMYLKVPLIGRVYYRRVADGDAVVSAGTPAATAAAPTAPGSAAAGAIVPAAAGPSSGAADAGTPTDYRVLLQRAEAAMRSGEDGEAQRGLEQAAASPFSHPAVDYDFAVLAARAGDTEAAISRLSDAFRQGFRQFDRVDSAREFDAMRTDVRFRALVDRYR